MLQRYAKVQSLYTLVQSLYTLVRSLYALVRSLRTSKPMTTRMNTRSRASDT